MNPDPGANPLVRGVNFLDAYASQWRVYADTRSGVKLYSVEWGRPHAPEGHSGWHATPVAAIDSALAEIRKQRLEKSQ